MTIGVLACDGDITLSGGAPACSGVWVQIPAPTPFDVTQLDPAVMAQAFGVGFGIVLTCWGTARGIKALLDLVKPLFSH